MYQSIIQEDDVKHGENYVFWYQAVLKKEKEGH